VVQSSNNATINTATCFDPMGTSAGLKNMVSYKVHLLLLLTGSRGLHCASYKNVMPRDPVGSNNRCTLYDTIFYKPEDDPMGSKHVAVLIVTLF